MEYINRIIAALMLASLASCGGIAPATALQPQPVMTTAPDAGVKQRFALNWEHQEGQAEVIIDGEAVTYMVEVRGLAPQRSYELAVETDLPNSDETGGAMFDRNNAQIEVGAALSETHFTPDAAGVLRFQHPGPTRMLRGATAVRLIVYEATAAWPIVTRSEPLVVGEP